jgi:hypothetical protein
MLFGRFIMFCVLINGYNSVILTTFEITYTSPQHKLKYQHAKSLFQNSLTAGYTFIYSV